MEEIEKVFYHSKPFLVLGLGIYLVSAPLPNPFVVGIALLLMLWSAFILRMRMKAKGVKGAEALFYEFQPFIYIGLSGYTLLEFRESKLGVGSALLLIFCGTQIIRWRSTHRH